MTGDCRRRAALVKKWRPAPATRLTMTAWLSIFVSASFATAGDYAIDAVHSSVTFKVEHLAISWVHGRFNEVTGNITLNDSDPEKSTFAASIPVASIDTNNKSRDAHLKGEGFFNVKEFPNITFKSTAVKRGDRGYKVIGDFTMHGVTKPITLTFKVGKEVQFPPGTKRIGFTAELTLKRTDFGMKNMVGPVGDEVYIALGVEATRK
jgi:polyisoprenoid-binding protein YceI